MVRLEYKKNLFSVLAAQDRNTGSRFESTATESRLEVNGVTVLSRIREIGGTLYKAAIQPIQPEEAGINIVTSSSSILQLYHEMWGHENKRYVKEKLEREMGIKVEFENEICEPCIY